MINSSFWHKWLVGLGIVMVVFGLSFALFNATPLFDIFKQQIDPVFWPSPEEASNVQDFRQWIYGVLGATMAGWGVFITFVAHIPFRRREKWAWNCIALGVLLWYVFDTAMSLRFQVYFNAVFNTLLLLAVALPLIITRKDFQA